MGTFKKKEKPPMKGEVRELPTKNKIWTFNIGKNGHKKIIPIKRRKKE